jgi:hypothetical protein
MISRLQATLLQPGRARLVAAMALHCLPLLAAASFFVRGLFGETAQQTWFFDLRWLVVLSACSWGLGYLPFPHWGRAAAAFAAGLVGNLLLANAALAAWSVAPDGAGNAMLNRAALAWGCLIVVAVLALLGDTWRLVHNTRASSPGPAPNVAGSASITG